MNTIGIIPVRLKASRLPGKPLVDLGGKSLVQRVWEQARKATSLTHVAIATEDAEIADHAHSFGAEVIMTRSDHETGSDRVAEAAALAKKKFGAFDLIANVQGDMPFINPHVIDAVTQGLATASEDFGMSTLGSPIMDEAELYRDSTVKIAVSVHGAALYFSRSPIPYITNRSQVEISEQEPYAIMHHGLYVFRPSVLENFSQLRPTINEKRERLEQLRVLANGIKIKVIVCARSDVQPAIEINTPEDIESALKYLKLTLP